MSYQVSINNISTNGCSGSQSQCAYQNCLKQCEYDRGGLVDSSVSAKDFNGCTCNITTVRAANGQFMASGLAASFDTSLGTLSPFVYDVAQHVCDDNDCDPISCPGNCCKPFNTTPSCDSSSWQTCDNRCDCWNKGTTSSLPRCQVPSGGLCPQLGKMQPSGGPRIVNLENCKNQSKCQVMCNYNIAGMSNNKAINDYVNYFGSGTVAAVGDNAKANLAMLGDKVLPVYCLQQVSTCPNDPTTGQPMPFCPRMVSNAPALVFGQKTDFQICNEWWNTGAADTVLSSYCNSTQNINNPECSCLAAAFNPSLEKVRQALHATHAPDVCWWKPCQIAVTNPNMPYLVTHNQITDSGKCPNICQQIVEIKNAQIVSGNTFAQSMECINGQATATNPTTPAANSSASNKPTPVTATSNSNVFTGNNANAASTETPFEKFLKSINMSIGVFIAVCVLGVIVLYGIFHLAVGYFSASNSVSSGTQGTSSGTSGSSWSLSSLLS